MRTQFEDFGDWYVVQLKPNGSRTALRNLTQQGFTTFAPMIDVTVARRHQFLVQRKPLFGNYIFVRVRPDQSEFRAINNTYGVSRLVKFGLESTPRKMPEDVMAELMVRCDDRMTFCPSENFSIGDAVVIGQGPFVNLTATLTRMSTQERVWVLLNALGRAGEVEVHLRSLSALSAV